MIRSTSDVAFRNQTHKRIRITEVNSSNLWIEGVDQINATFKVDWNFQSETTYVPQVGEEWIISLLDNLWKLAWKVESNNSRIPLKSLSPGDLRLEGNRILIEADSIFIHGQEYIPVATAYSEVPDGLIDGSNKTYNTKNPYISNSLRAYREGLRVSVTEVTQMTFKLAIAPTTSILVDYDYDYRYRTQIGQTEGMHG